MQFTIQNCGNYNKRNIKSMLEPKLRDLTKLTQIESSIHQIEQTKSELKSVVNDHFIEFKKKIMASIDKAEKIFIAKINDACTSSIDTLTKINATELDTFEVEKYVHKTKKFTEKMKAVDIEKIVKTFQQQVKNCIDQVKRIKVLEDVPKITETNEMIKFDKTIKVEGEPLQNLFFINHRLAQVSKTSITIQKHSIQKKFDAIVPIFVRNKSSQILFTLSNGDTIGLYSSKLVLHSFRKFVYDPLKLVKVVQLNNYIYIAEKNKVTRINLANLNQIFIKVFSEEIVAFSSQLYQGYAVVGFITGRVLYIQHNNEMENIYAYTVNGRISQISVIDIYLIITFPNGVKIWKNAQQIELSPVFAGLKVLYVAPLVKHMMFITQQSHIYTLDPQVSIQPKRVNAGFTKILKNVAVNGYDVYCLGQYGTKIFVHGL